MKRRTSGALGALCLFLNLAMTGCGGNGGLSGPLPISPTKPMPSASGNAKLVIVVPQVAVASAHRLHRPDFVSPSTNAAQVVASAGASQSTTIVDLSAASAACNITGGSRNCLLSVTVPFGSVTFSVTTYDLAPVNGAIPANAHVLGKGSTTQVVTAGGGAIDIAVDAEINGYGNLPAFTSIPGDGQAHTYAYVLNPADFDNNPIANGTNDPFSNPITATLTETGGTGHAHLMLNGANSGSSATLTKSTDTIAVAYDGAATVGYSIGVAFGAQGVAVLTSTVSPLFVTSASPSYASPTLSLSGTNGATFTVSEAGAPPTVAYVATGTGCANVAAVGAVGVVGGVPSFTVNGITRGNCTVSVTDGISTLIFNVANAGITGTALGPNHVFAGTVNGVEAFSITAALAAAPNIYVPAPAPQPLTPIGLVYAFDHTSGILWYAQAPNQIEGFDDGTGVALTNATLSGTSPAGALAVDSSGTLYACVNGANAEIQVFAFGSVAPGTTAQTTMQTCSSLAVDANGYIYALDTSTNTMNVYAPLAANAGATAAVQQRQVTAAQAGWQQPTDLALDPTGHIFVNDASAAVGGIFILASGTTGAASSAPIGGIQYISPLTLMPAPPAAVAVDSSGNVVVCSENLNNPANAPGYIFFYTAAQEAQLVAGGQPTGNVGEMNAPGGDFSGCGALVAY